MLPQKPSGGRITAGQFPQPSRRSHNVEFLVFLVAMTCILTQGAMTFLAASTVTHQVEHRITEVTSYE